MTTKLKLKMEQHGVTVTGLAAKLGVRPSAIKNATIRGINTISCAKRYAAALGVAPLDLLEL